MSTHEVKVVRITEINVHPNANALELIPVWGYTACARLGEFKVGELVCYIEPDYVVPDTEQFAFLNGKRRIKCKRLRGIMSQGLLIKAPEGVQEGDDVMELLGIIRYEPPVKAFRGFGGCTYRARTMEASPPDVPDHKYGLENYRKHKWAIKPGDMVWIREKIHGCCSSYVFHNDQMHVKSHGLWRKDIENDPFWTALRQNPWIEEWCRAHPDHLLLGEVYGSVQDLEYGMDKDSLGFAAFDVLHNGIFWTPEQFHLENLGMKAPLLYCGEFSEEELLKHVDGKTIMPGASHIREGVVIQTVNNIGRVALKFVSDEYLSRQ